MRKSQVAGKSGTERFWVLPALLGQQELIKLYSRGAAMWRDRAVALWLTLLVGALGAVLAQSPQYPNVAAGACL